jgi:hypothetical protein
MEKAKHTPSLDALDVPRKIKESAAPIEFVAPYDLRDCRLRLRDTRRQEPGFFSAGFDPSFEELEDGVIRFRIRRTWYDVRWRRHTSMVEMQGYLKAIDEQSTAIIAAVYISWWVGALLLVLTLGLIGFAVVSNELDDVVWLLVTITALVVPFAFRVYFDRRALCSLIYRAMSELGV